MITDDVKSIIAEYLEISLDSLAPETTFEELGANSIQKVEIVMQLEERFGFRIHDADIKQFSSLRQVCDFIQEQTCGS